MKRTCYIALLTSLALISPAVAHAGPDDGKAVGTQAHIDAPKTYWTGDNFDLRALKETPLDKAVLWVGKGYNERGGQQQYQSVLPAAMADVAEPGKTYYTAPRNPSSNHNPIWWGYGADESIPTETFNQSAASMDLLSVEGPGEVEMFVDQGYETRLKRLIGTAQGSPKSVKIYKRLHTHNDTLFTKPGRYVLTYRSTARTHDGALVASAPQRLAVQVGGNKPADTPTPSLRERFDAAPQGDAAAAGYELSIAPKAAQEKDGDEHLSTISFNAANKANGTLTLLIDGYFLTDLEVKDGHVEWNEMLGPLHSDIQAVFTSDGDAPRWVSQPLRYSPGESVTTTSAESAETWMDNEGKVRELQATEEIPLGAKGLKYRVERVSDKAIKFIVDAEDKNFSGFIEGGFYSSPEDEFATDQVELNIRNGHGEALVSNNSWLKGTTLRFELIPHPLYQATGSTVTLTENFDPATPVEGTSELSPLGSPKPEPKPGATSSQSPWAWLGPVLGLGVIGALLAAVLSILHSGKDPIAQLKNQLGLHF